MAFPDGWLHVKNWEKFQYRSDKKLPWIRLECGLLQDLEFLKFDRATQRDLIAIWLLARNQSHAGWIPSDSKVVTKLIQGGRNLDLQVFVNSGFLEEKCALQDMRRHDKTGEDKKTIAPKQQKALLTEPPYWKGEILPVTTKSHKALIAAYPVIDFECEYRKADEWLVNHPGNRKKDFSRFLSNWFRRAQYNLDRNQMHNGGKGHGRHYETARERLLRSNQELADQVVVEPIRKPF